MAEVGIYYLGTSLLSWARPLLYIPCSSTVMSIKCFPPFSGEFRSNDWLYARIYRLIWKNVAEKFCGGQDTACLIFWIVLLCWSDPLFLSPVYLYTGETDSSHYVWSVLSRFLILQAKCCFCFSSIDRTQRFRKQAVGMTSGEQRMFGALDAKHATKSPNAGLRSLAL